MIAIVEGADLNSLNTALLSGLTVLPVDPAFDVAHRLLASHFETLFNSAVRQVSSVLAASSSLVAPLNNSALATIRLLKSSVILQLLIPLFDGINLIPSKNLIIAPLIAKHWSRLSAFMKQLDTILTLLNDTIRIEQTNQLIASQTFLIEERQTQQQRLLQLETEKAEADAARAEVTLYGGKLENSYVETPFGTGKVKGFREADGIYELILCDWNMADSKNPVVFCAADQIKDSSRLCDFDKARALSVEKATAENATKIREALANQVRINSEHESKIESIRELTSYITSVQSHVLNFSIALSTIQYDGSIFHAGLSHQLHVPIDEMNIKLPHSSFYPKSISLAAALQANFASLALPETSYSNLELHVSPTGIAMLGVPTSSSVVKVSDSWIQAPLVSIESKVGLPLSPASSTTAIAVTSSALNTSAPQVVDAVLPSSSNTGVPSSNLIFADVDYSSWAHVPDLEQPSVSFTQLHHLEQISYSNIALLESTLLQNGVVDLRCLTDIRLEDTSKCAELAERQPLLQLVSDIFYGVAASPGALIFAAIRAMKPVPVGRSTPELEQAIRAHFCALVLVNPEFSSLILSVASLFSNGTPLTHAEILPKLAVLKTSCFAVAEDLRRRLTFQVTANHQNAGSAEFAKVVKEHCEAIPLLLIFCSRLAINVTGPIRSAKLQNELNESVRDLFIRSCVYQEKPTTPLVVTLHRTMLARTGLAQLRLRSLRKICSLLDLLSTSPAVSQILKVAKLMLGGGTLLHPLDGTEGASLAVRSQLSVAFHEILRRVLAIATDSYLTWPTPLVRKLSLSVLACRFKSDDFSSLQSLNIFSTLKQLINPPQLKLLSDHEPSREQPGFHCSLHAHCLRVSAPSRNCNKCNVAVPSSTGTIWMSCKPCYANFCPACFYASTRTPPTTDVQPYFPLPQKGLHSDAAWALFQLYTQQLKNVAELSVMPPVTSQLLDSFNILREQFNSYIKGMSTSLSKEEKEEFEASQAHQKSLEIKSAQQKEASLQNDIISALNSLSQGSGSKASPAASPSLTPAKFNPGDSLIGLWRGNSKWYTGRIRDENSNGTYYVQFDDGDVDPQLVAKNIKLRSWASDAVLDVGDRVLASSSNHSDYRNGRIENVKTDAGLFTIVFDDEEFDEAVTRDCIILLGKGSSSGLGAFGDSSWGTSEIPDHGFTIGARVRVRPGVTPSTGWGRVEAGDIGVVTSVKGPNCTVKFEKHEGWSGGNSYLNIKSFPAQYSRVIAFFTIYV